MSIEVEIEELACKAMGLNDEQMEETINNNNTDNLLYKQYGIDLETYCKIVQDLIPFTPKQETAITKEIVQGFVEEENGYGRFIVKQKSETKS